MTRPITAADRGTYIGLLRTSPVSACCTHRPDSAPAYTCICGQRWCVTQDGWIRLGRAAGGDCISVRQISREA